MFLPWVKIINRQQQHRQVYIYGFMKMLVIGDKQVPMRVYCGCLYVKETSDKDSNSKN